MTVIWRTRLWVYVRRHKLIAWTVIAIAASAMFAAVDAHAPVSSSDWASWAQAIGSLVALCVAIWMQHSASHDQTVKADSAAILLSEQLWQTLIELESLCHTEQREMLVVQAGRLKALRTLSSQIRIDVLSTAITSDFISIVALIEEADVHADMARGGITNLHHLAKLFKNDRQRCGESMQSMQASGIEWHSTPYL